MTIKGNQRISCSVENCSHNAQGQGCCMLDSINVCNGSQKVRAAKDSMCASFCPHSGI